VNLERDEKIVLDNGPLGLGKKLTLTNKHLLIHKDEGVFDVNWKQEKVIPLNTVEDAYIETESFSNLSSFKLKLKNGKSIELSLSLDNSWLINDSPETKMNKEKSSQLKMLNYRWVKAITNQLMKLDKQKKTVFIRKCPKCSKEITHENYEYCPFCGNLLKSKYLF